jgi:DNA-binding response OmpR family regulator
LSPSIPTILCINQNPETLKLLAVILKYEGYKIITAQSKTSGFINAQSGIFNLIILDVNLADGSGIDLCKEIREFDQKTPIIFYSADDSPKLVEEAMKAGAQAYLKQLVVPNVLLETVARLLHHPR